MHMCRCVSCTSACPFHGVIRLRANRAAVRQPVQAPPTVSFPPPSGNPVGAVLCGVLGYPNRHTGVHPRHRLAGCRLGGRHDGAKGTRGGERAVRARCILLRCRSYYYCVIPGSEPESWAALCGVLRYRIAGAHSRTCPPRPRVGARGDRQRGKRGDKGLPYTKNRRKRFHFRRDKSLWFAAV